MASTGRCWCGWGTSCRSEVPHWNAKRRRWRLPCTLTVCPWSFLLLIQRSQSTVLLQARWRLGFKLLNAIHGWLLRCLLRKWSCSSHVVTKSLTQDCVHELSQGPPCLRMHTIIYVAHMRPKLAWCNHAHLRLQLLANLHLGLLWCLCYIGPSLVT